MRFERADSFGQQRRGDQGRLFLDLELEDSVWEDGFALTSATRNFLAATSSPLDPRQCALELVEELLKFAFEHCEGRFDDQAVAAQAVRIAGVYA